MDHRLDDILAPAIERRIRVMESISTDSELMSAIKLVASKTVDLFRRGGRLFLCGNGGSFADCLHIAGEFVGRFKVADRKGFSAHVLGSNSAALTAIANDYGYEFIFVRELEAKACPGDMLWAFSTSGSSVNVIRVLERARDIGVLRVVFSKYGHTPAMDLADVYIGIPSDETPIIQEAHKIICHIIAEWVESTMVGSDEK